ncbi:DUF6264 family protein [Agreia pratensis]|uniref:Uncharacterized protein n=1 Tax=Agreia pratensis TaxID=150121 RepID=A0A1X7KIN7_9MICO|nr:DUF6264 family protein [Agreia pratensis]SMG41272.1 hypothetical protein SAMN06296010_2580 [Agreia pratensis]
MSNVPPIEPSEPARDDRPRPRYGEYAPASQTPPVEASPTDARPQHPAAEAQPFAASTFTPTSAVFHNAPPAKPKTLGVVAFVAGLVVLLFAVVLSVVGGLAFAPIAGKAITAGGVIDQTVITSDDPGIAAFGVLSTVFFVAGSLLGLWALVQGLIATITKRGRAFGIVAMALAVATPVISFVVFYAVTFASAPEIFSNVG